VTRHTGFARGVNEAMARRRPCPDCGGRFSDRLNRIWHRFDCPRMARILGRPQSEREQDAERAELAGCPHGYDNWLECPGCTEEADRLHKERSRMSVAEEYDRVLESQRETRL